MFQLAVRERTELFQVILHFEIALVDGELTENRVEVQPPLRHPSTGLGGAVSLRVHEEISIRLRSGVESLRHQGRSAIKRLPLLPSFQLESKGSARACQPDGVNSQCLDQIELDLAQHLQWLNDLHWGAGGVECKGLAKLVD